MTEQAAVHGPVITWSWAGRALEQQSGDLHVVASFRDGALVGLIDGLGHGPEAAVAARAAAKALETCARDAVEKLMQRCHEALRGTRGAVISLASISSAESSMTWIGIGNVDASLFRHDGTRDAVAGRGGVLGFRIPSLRAHRVPIAPNDTLIMVTDGIYGDYCHNLDLQCGTQQLADDILARFAKGYDDAHVVVARYLGSPHERQRE